MLSRIILIINCLVNTAIFAYFCNSVYKKKYSSEVPYLFAYTLCFVVKTLVSFIGIASLNTFSTVLFLVVISSILFKPDNKIVKNFLFIMYLIWVEFFVFALSTFFTNHSSHNFYFSAGLFNPIIMICTSVIITRLLGSVSLTKNTFIVCAFMIIISVIEVIILLVLLNSQFESVNVMLVISIGYLAIDSGILYFYHSLTKQYEIQQELSLQKQNTEMLDSYCRDIQLKYDHTLTVLHDMKGHINALYCMTSSEWEERDRYVSELYSQIDELGYSVKCSSRILNSIIAFKLSICSERNIKLNIKLGNVHLDFMREIDITALFSNLLNNAIECCENLPNDLKWIDLQVFMHKKHVVIRSKNPMNPNDISYINGKHTSTKGGHFGIGLINIERIVDLYNGAVNISQVNNEFSISLYLDIGDYSATH